MYRSRETMLEIFLVLNIYSDPDGELEAMGFGGGGGLADDVNRELLRQKYASKKKEPNAKLELQRQRQMKLARLMELERTRRLEEEVKRKAAEYKANNEPKPDPPKVGMGRKKNIEGRRLSYYLEERKPKMSMWEKIYKTLRGGTRRKNFYDPLAEEEDYNPLLVVDEDVSFRESLRYKEIKLPRMARKLSKRKLQRRPCDDVVVNSVRELKDAVDDCPKFMGMKIFERERDMEKEEERRLLDGVD